MKKKFWNILFFSLIDFENKINLRKWLVNFWIDILFGWLFGLIGSLLF